MDCGTEGQGHLQSLLRSLLHEEHAQQPQSAHASWQEQFCFLSVQTIMENNCINPLFEKYVCAEDIVSNLTPASAPW